MKRWETLDKKDIFCDRWVSLHKSKVKLPNEVIIPDFYTVDISDAAAIIALTEDGKVVLKREYRYAYDKELIEIPAGTFECGEDDGLLVAKRELLEETGYTSDKWMYLGATIESSSKLTNVMHIYFADECKKISEQKLDETEEIEVLLVSLNEAVEMVMNNIICCNSSAAAILKVATLMSQNK